MLLQKTIIFWKRFSSPKNLLNDHYTPSVKRKPILLFCFNQTSCWDEELQSPVKGRNFDITISSSKLFWIIVKLIGSTKDYLKQDSSFEYFCDAEIVVENRSDFDPRTACGEDFFLPYINSAQHIQHLSLILQVGLWFITYELKVYFSHVINGPGRNNRLARSKTSMIRFKD